MKISCSFLVAMIVALVGCDRIKEQMGGGGSDAAAGKPSATTPAAAAPGKKEPENLFSAGSGAMVVSFDPKNTTNYDEWLMLDDKQPSYWMPGQSGAKSYKLVLALPQPTTVKKLSFSGAAKKITVEASGSPLGKDGFEKIAEATLAGTEKSGYEGAPFQPIPVTKETQARSYRITFELVDGLWHNNELRAEGVKHAEPTFPVANLTGEYGPMEGSLGTARVKQTGNVVSACLGGYEFTGEIEGGLVKGTWWSATGTKEPLPGAFNVTADGSTIVFLRYTGASGALFKYAGPRSGAKPGTCSLWKDEGAPAPAVDPIAADIERFGRTRIYGIKFDTDSDVPRPESKAVIDRVIAVMKAKPDWKLTVEGHTDDTSTADYNQGLSDRRAKAVKKALESGGIAPARLDAKGYGQTKPVAPNDTGLGRAENRRVELAKQ